MGLPLINIWKGAGLGISIHAEGLSTLPEPSRSVLILSFAMTGKSASQLLVQELLEHVYQARRQGLTPLRV